jgi:predicted acyltransferase
LAKIAKRSVTIIALGLLLCLLPKLGGPLSEVRLPSVLQRIGLCFGIAALMLHFWQARGAAVFAVLALAGHWLVLALWGDYSLAGNAAAKVDLWLLGERHVYHGEGIPFDPEGVLGTLPATVNVIAGYFAGRLLMARGANWETLARLMMAGVVCVAVALCWSGVLPVNKKLWTGSYVLLTIGLDLLILPLLVYAIELRGLRRGTYFFEVFGKNTLFIYLLSEVLVIVMVKTFVGATTVYDWLYATAFAPLAASKAASLLFAVVFMLGCWLVGWWLDRRRIYIKV